MYGVAVYVKEGFPFEQDLSLEKTLRIFIYVWTCFTSFDFLLLFPPSIAIFLHGF